ncbi:MAG: glycosyltransferase [Lysobacter sp.]|nr:glycosyltransferase [Lysobacter sp.]MDV5980793.1 glycosyltransferase [Lysobacter sp.]
MKARSVRPASVVHVVENLERGGLERVVIELVRAQRALGMRCRVVCLFGRGALADELAADGVDVSACGKRRGPDMRALRRLRAQLRHEPGAVLHTHNAVAHYYAVLAAIGLPLRQVVNTRHAMPTTGGSGRREWLYRQAMRLTDVCVAVCEAARRQLQAHGVRPRKGLVAIPNGIRLERYRPASDASRRQLVEVLGLPRGTVLVGSVGRLNRVKDQASLIRAFGRVHQAMPATALLLIGDGPEREALAEVAHGEGVYPAVHFMGDRGDVDVLLQGLDLFVMSSVSEGYSIALLEASAAGLPIVATDVGGNGEIVRNAISGRLVPASDPVALAEAMLSILDDRELAGRMGSAGRAWVLECGSFRSMAERYAAVYAGMVFA